MTASEREPSTSGDGELLARCIEFQLRLEHDSVERVLSLATGVALLSPSTPLIRDANLLLVERTGLGPGEIVAAADEAIGGSGMDHRTVLVADPSDGERLRPAFERLGWETERILYMAWGREPDREPALEASEIPYAQLRALRRAIIGEPEDIAAEALEQLLAADPVMPEGVSDRWFAARLEGRVVSGCRLISRAGVGQVEAVGTLPDARGQGAARAAVLAAARASVDAGHELTFIPADADDWPWLLYRRLGFDPLGSVCVFRRAPPA